MDLVARRAFCDRQRPVDGERRVERIQATFGIRLVGGGVKVEHFAIVGECLETVREAFRNDKCLVIVGAQTLGMPFQAGRRALPQVYSDVEDLATQAGDQFHFSMGRKLEMHTAQRPGPSREGMVDLDNISIADYRLKILHAEQPLKVTTLIADGQALNDFKSDNRRRLDIKTLSGLHRSFSEAVKASIS